LKFQITILTRRSHNFKFEKIQFDHFTIKAISSYLASKHKTTIFLANPPYTTSFASFYCMTNPPQHVCFNIWVDKKTLPPKKHLTNLTCKICTSRFYHTARYHIQSQAAFSSTRKLHPSYAVEEPHNPQTKLPELVVATKEGNCRETKTG
jgi:hypothetical protein